MKSFTHYAVTTSLLFSISALSASVTMITSENQFNDLIINSGKPAVVKIGAPWCPSCVRAEGPFHKLADEFPDTIFATLDYDANTALAKKYHAESLPTFLYFNNGTVVDTKVGYSENFKNEVRGVLSRMKPTGAEAMPMGEKKSMSESTGNAMTEVAAPGAEEGMTCPAQGESFFETAYAAIRDFFTSIGDTVRSWFR